MKARIVFLILCCIWGSTWLFIKLGLRDLPPITFAAVRFMLAASILFAIVKVRRVPLPRERYECTLLLKTGVLAFTFNYGLVFWGEQHISSGLAALLQATIPAYGMLIAHAYLPGERLNARKMAGVLLGIFGVGVIFSNQLGAEGGHALAFEGNPFAMRWTSLAVMCLLYLTLVGSVAAFLLYYWLVRNMDVTKTMLIALVTPLAAVLLGMVTLDERLTWRVFAGGALIMSGVALVVLRRTRAAAKVEEADVTASVAE